MKEIFIIAEIGINHCGDVDIAKRLIKSAKDAGANAVKFQKRCVDLVYSQEFLAMSRESVWGTTQRDQKNGLELSMEEYEAIDSYCRELSIDWFASAWDVESQKFLQKFGLRFNKIASAMVTNLPLIEIVAAEGLHTFISTGMHDLEEIDSVVEIFQRNGCSFELMHCCSVYPMDPALANLRVIETLRQRFSCDVGYSGHETGLAVSVAAASLGVTSLERHITLDRAMQGSDQAASVEPGGFEKLVRMVRVVESAMGSPEKKILEDEKAIRRKLAPLDYPFEH